MADHVTVNVNTRRSGPGCTGGCLLFLLVLIPVGAVAKLFQASAVGGLVLVALVLVAATVIGIAVAQGHDSTPREDPRVAAPATPQQRANAIRYRAEAQARVVDGTCTWCHQPDHGEDPKARHRVEIEAAVQRAMRHDQEA